MTTTTSKPVIVIVPGGWHKPAHYAHLALKLNSHGYTVDCIDHPSLSSDLDTSKPIFAQDVTAIRDAITSHIDADRDVVVVMHSYGGLPGSEAAAGLGKKEGKAGVVQLVYMAAWMVVEGWEFSMKPEGCPAVATMDENKNIIAIDPRKHFYHDVPEQIYQRAVDNLVPMPAAALSQGPSKVAWREIPSSYILCEEDAAIPPWVAEQLIDTVKDQGVDVEVVTLKASHSPFLSMPGETAEVIRKLLGEKV